MNMNAILATIMPALSPMVQGTVYISDGYAIAPDGTQMPQWLPVTAVSLRFQAMTGDDLQKIDAVDQQAILRAVYINGNVEGIDRLNQKGGDWLAVNGVTWKIARVLETWDTGGWCKVAACQQAMNVVP